MLRTLRAPGSKDDNHDVYVFIQRRSQADFGIMLVSYPYLAFRRRRQPSIESCTYLLCGPLISDIMHIIVADVRPLTYRSKLQVLYSNLSRLRPRGE